MTTRIDPPHVMAGAAPTTEPHAAAEAPAALSALASALGASSPRMAAPGQANRASTAEAVDPPAWQFSAMPVDGLALEQLQNQAAQLGAQLSKQQTALDRREAEVNARAAAVENQIRAARLWLAEKLETIARHNTDATWSDIAETLARAETGNDPFDSSSATGHHSEGAGNWQQGWQEQFELWRSERAMAADGSSDAAPHPSTIDPALETAAAAFHRHQEADQRLETAEARLAARAAELETKRVELLSERADLDAQREAFAVQRQEERWRLAEQRRTMSEKATRQRARLRRRREDFDARETALRQMRADLLRAQQQTLEMRLAAEELWARLRGKATAADLAAARGNHPLDDERREGAA